MDVTGGVWIVDDCEAPPPIWPLTMEAVEWVSDLSVRLMQHRVPPAGNHGGMGQPRSWWCMGQPPGGKHGEERGNNIVDSVSELTVGNGMNVFHTIK